MEPVLSLQFWLISVLLVFAALAFYYFYFKRSEKKQPFRDAYLLGLKFMAEKDNRRAVEKFKETVRHDTNNIDAYIKLGDILRAEGLYFNAVRIHKDLSLRGNVSLEDNHKIRFSLAMDYWHSKQYEKAKEYFQKLREVDEYREKAVSYLVQIYELNEDYKEAFDVLKDSPFAIRDESKQKLALFKVMEGLDLVEKGDEKNARIIFKEALKFDPACSAAYTYIGDSYIREKRLDDAINIWTEFCKKVPLKSYVLYPRLEKTWYEKGHFLKIEELYESILKEDPNNIRALLALTSIHRKKGDFQTALSLVQDSLKQDMDEDILRAESARILFEKSQYKEAAQQSINLIEKLTPLQSNKFICSKCGYISEEPFWKCNKCKTLNLNI